MEAADLSYATPATDIQVSTDPNGTTITFPVTRSAARWRLIWAAFSLESTLDSLLSSGHPEWSTDRIRRARREAGEFVSLASGNIPRIRIWVDHEDVAVSNPFWMFRSRAFKRAYVTGCDVRMRHLLLPSRRVGQLRFLFRYDPPFVAVRNYPLLPLRELARVVSASLAGDEVDARSRKE